MREIKFRAYDPNANAMHNNIGIDKIGLYDFDGDAITEQEALTIMQYTGLNDKNGKEIYEGDLLGGIYEYLYVAYCDNCKQFQCKVVMDDVCMACSGDVHWCEVVHGKDVEVIGNIYENPELLEVDK